MTWGFCPVCKTSVRLKETPYNNGVVVYTIQNHWLFYGTLYIPSSRQCTGSQMTYVYTPKEKEKIKVSIEEIPCNNTI